MWLGLLLAPPTPDGGLSLHLDRAALEHPADEVALLSCSARWHNRTGTSLATHTNFYGLFDGVVLVIADAQGRELHRQPYTAHLSPYAMAQPLTLPVGETTAVLVFPLDTALLPGAHRLWLEGGLVGHAELSTGFTSEPLPL